MKVKPLNHPFHFEDQNKKLFKNRLNMIEIKKTIV